MKTKTEPNNHKKQSHKTSNPSKQAKHAQTPRNAMQLRRQCLINEKKKSHETRNRNCNFQDKLQCPRMVETLQMRFFFQ